MKPGPKEREAMGREPAWDCRLPRRGRHTRYAWSESLLGRPCDRGGSQGQGEGGRPGRLSSSLWDASRLGRPGGKEREAKRMSWELLACSFRRCKQYTKANLSSIQSRVFLHLGKLFMRSTQSYFIGRNIAQKRRQPVLPDCLFGLHPIILCFAEPTGHYCT